MGTVKNRTDRKTFRRLAVAFCLFIVIAVVIVGRLAKYQLRDYDYYEAQVIGRTSTRRGDRSPTGTASCLPRTRRCTT